MIVLDIDVLIEVYDKRSEEGEEAQERSYLERITESGESVATTAVNLHEILYGFKKYSKQVRSSCNCPC